jgi:hypothetical protein
VQILISFKNIKSVAYLRSSVFYTDGRDIYFYTYFLQKMYPRVIAKDMFFDNEQTIRVQERFLVKTYQILCILNVLILLKMRLNSD